MKWPIKGRLIRGWCFKCGSRATISELYDAYCCLKCDDWLESTCQDPTCVYCKSRPLKPSFMARLIPEDFNS